MHKPGFTRRQLAAVICFALLFAGLFLCVEKCLFSDIFFSPTWTRIREERKAPQVLVMGNSHAFCSFAPQIINGALGVDSAVLGASGQHAAGAVDSFEAVLRVDAPEVLVAELNVFLSPHDSMAVNSKASALSNINGMPHLIQRVKSAWHQFGFENIPQGAFQHRNSAHFLIIGQISINRFSLFIQRGIRKKFSQSGACCLDLGFRHSPFLFPDDPAKLTFVHGLSPY